MNDIKKEIDILFKNVETSRLYKDYLNVKKQLSNNKEIMNLIDEIKRLQKIATNNKDSHVEKEIKKLYDKLNNYPIYQSYIDIKEELNIELSTAKDIFEDYFNKILKM